MATELRMGDTLEALQRLQAIELKLAELRRAREARERRIDHCQRQIKKADERLQESAITIRNRQMSLDAFQLDVSQREQAIDKHRQALNTAKTNKEYAGILTALNTEKADTAKLETEMLQLMEEMQTLKDEATLVEDQKEQLAADATKAEVALGEFEADSKVSFDELQTRRDECAEGLEPTTLSTFSRVAEHHDGEALVPAVRLHPKREDYLCSGCNMTLTMEVISILQSGSNIEVCKVCGRILYLPTG